MQETNSKEVWIEVGSMYPVPQLKVEVWTQDPEETDLWHGPHGVIVNTAALEERKSFFSIITRGADE
jgi:hypothetical protein